jgi:hypothetical protein
MTFAFSESLYLLYQYSGKFTQFSCFLLLIWALINIKYCKGDYLFIFILVFMFSLFELVRYYHWESHGLLDGAYIFISIILQCIFYFRMTKTFWLKRYIQYGIPLLLGLLVFAYLRYQLSILFVVSIESAILFVMYLQAHRELNSISRIIKYYKNPFYWFNISLLILCVFYLLFGILIPLVREDSKDVFHILYAIRNLMGPITCILWMMAICKMKSWDFKRVSSL